jgi:hypothetical protein
MAADRRIGSDEERHAVSDGRDGDRAASASRVVQVIDFAFFLVLSLLGLEIALELLGARQSSGFKQFLDAVTAPLVQPFAGLLPNPSFRSAQLMLTYVAALVVYAILHQAIRRLVRIVAGPRH